MCRNSINRYMRDKINVIEAEITSIDSELGSALVELSAVSKLPAVNRAVPKIRNAMTWLENISEEIGEIKAKLSQYNSGSAKSHTRPIPHPLKQIHKIEINYGAFGSAEVSIDDLMPFHLSPNLASLLEILAADSDSGITAPQNSNDPLVPYKNTYVIILSMTKILGGKRYTERALRQSIHRLRKILRDNGFDGLIQTNRQIGGYRLALRRKKQSGNTTSSL